MMNEFSNQDDPSVESLFNIVETKMFRQNQRKKAEFIFNITRTIKLERMDDLLGKAGNLRTLLKGFIRASQIPEVD